MFRNPEFWVGLAFVVFVAGVVRLAGRKILRELDARAERIRIQLDEARQLREETQATLASYQRKQRDAVKEAAEIVNHASEEAEASSKRAAADLKAAMVRREKLAMDLIAQAEADAAHEVRRVAANIAVTAAGKLVKENLDKVKANKLVAEAIKELPKKLH